MASKKGKILIVDDNAGIRQALKILLPMYFAEVETLPSPVMSTVASVGAILSTVFRMAIIGMDEPQYIRSPEVSSAVSVLTSRPFAFRALSLAAVSVDISLSLSHGFTRKSNAPRFIPSTASWMSA